MSKHYTGKFQALQGTGTRVDYNEQQENGEAKSRK